MPSINWLEPQSKLAKRVIVLLVTLMLVASFNFTTAFVAAADTEAAGNSSRLGSDTILSNDGMKVESLPADIMAKATQSGGMESGNLLTKAASTNAASDDIGINKVIGVDNRIQVNPTTTYPYRAVVHISSSIGGCTGWLIGPRTVATAGHCVFNNGAWATNVVVTPGRNGLVKPYGSSQAHRLFSVAGWVNSGNGNYDYGAIQLKKPLGDTVGWFGFRWTSASLQDTWARISGYPGDKPFGTQWRHQGYVNNGTYRLFYSIDTFNGQSGAPVYQLNYPNCGPCGIAIHTGGTTSGNWGTRIRQPVFNNLLYWKNYAFP